MTQVPSEKKNCKNGYFAENNKLSLRYFIENYDKLSKKLSTLAKNCKARNIV